MSDIVRRCVDTVHLLSHGGEWDVVLDIIFCAEMSCT